MIRGAKIIMRERERERAIAYFARIVGSSRGIL